MWQPLTGALCSCVVLTTQAYARLIELIVPSFVFGLLLVKLGLTAGIVLHVLYDVLWMSLPVFLSENTSVSTRRQNLGLKWATGREGLEGRVTDRWCAPQAKVMVVLCSAAPILLSAAACLHQGAVASALPEGFLNHVATAGAELRGATSELSRLESPLKPIDPTLRTGLPVRETGTCEFTAAFTGTAASALT